jgi:hypothetical protein
VPDAAGRARQHQLVRAHAVRSPADQAAPERLPVVAKGEDGGQQVGILVCVPALGLEQVPRSVVSIDGRGTVRVCVHAVGLAKGRRSPKVPATAHLSGSASSSAD